jgi:hypothetical protein
MKRIRAIFSTVLLTGLFTCFQVNMYAQKAGNIDIIKSGVDTNKITPIVYPPITEREGKGLTIPLPPNEHPRLFLRQKDIAVLKKKQDSPLLNACWGRIQRASTYSTDGFLPVNGVKNNNSEAIKNAIEAKALLYLFSQNPKTGRDAVETALNYFATLKIDNTVQDITREIGRAIVTGAIVYDWCYPLLTEKEKQILLARMEILATNMEIEWPHIKGSSLTGHTVEAQLSRDMLSLGIATYDENPEIYKRIAGRIFAEFVPARQFYYPAGYHHQGSAYGPYRFGWEMVATWLFDRMGYPNLYGKNQATIPYYFLYSRRPDGQLMRDGDDFTEQSAPFGKFWNLGQSMNLLAGSYHKDPIILNEALKEKPLGATADYLFDFLFFDPDVVGNTTKATLPLTRYFDEPYGAMIARTGWQDGLQSPAVVATMKVQAYNFSNHQHLDAGGFQLYYKGPLTVQSGIYQGKRGGYGSDHFKNYGQRSIAHNTMLIYNPNETFTWHGQKIGNEGGQFFPNDAHEPENMQELLTQGYQTGKVLAHAFGPDSIRPEFTYLKGDLTKAYSNKVKSFIRSFVFLNLNNATIPAALLVFDNVVSANKDYKKYWLLHCVEEPQINGNQTTVTRTGKGYGGKLINTTLLPIRDDLSLTKVGGSGNEYTVFGTNYPQSFQNPAISSGDSAVWRIEVSPKIASANNLFLNVMQVMDAGVNAPPARLPGKFNNEQFTGAKVGDRLVLFSKTGALVNQSFSLRITGSQAMKVLITDVKTGSWIVRSVNAVRHSPGLIKNTQSLLYFQAEPGNYIIQKSRIN